MSFCYISADCDAIATTPFCGHTGGESGWDPSTDIVEYFLIEGNSIADWSEGLIDDHTASIELEVSRMNKITAKFSLNNVGKRRPHEVSRLERISVSIKKRMADLVTMVRNGRYEFGNAVKKLISDAEKVDIVNDNEARDELYSRWVLLYNSYEFAVNCWFDDFEETFERNIHEFDIQCSMIDY